MDVKKKCYHCGRMINLETERFVYEQGKYYIHYSCYFNYAKSRKRLKNKTVEELRSYLDNKIEEQKEQIEKIIILDKLTNFLRTKYNLYTIPSYFYITLNDLNNGVYKNVTEKISTDEVYDMWVRKIDDLLKYHSYRKSVGKEIEDIKKLNYDLAVLVSKYTGYKAWKNRKEEEQRQSELERIQKENDSINYTKYASNAGGRRANPLGEDADDIAEDNDSDEENGNNEERE